MELELYIEVERIRVSDIRRERTNGKEMRTSAHALIVDL